jgi:phosphoglycolate phosphatase-like HAD superfamily hydrolase
MSKIQKIPQNIKMVGFDNDNTLTDQLEPQVVAMESMTAEFEELTEISAKVIRGSIARVFENHGTTDYHRVVQEMDCFAKMSEQMRDELVEIGKSIYKKVRDQYRPSYEGIPDVLKTLNENGIKCFVFSNAPIYQVLRRIKRTQLGHNYKLILGLRDEIAEVFPKLVKVQTALGQYSGKYEWRVVETPKPNANLAEMLSMDPEEVRENVAFVGDSFGSDMGLAAQNGCVGFHALYGSVDPWVRHRLRRFSTEKMEAQFRQNGESLKEIAKKTSIHELNRPGDLLKYLGIVKSK